MKHQIKHLNLGRNKKWKWWSCATRQDSFANLVAVNLMVVASCRDVLLGGHPADRIGRMPEGHGHGTSSKMLNRLHMLYRIVFVKIWFVWLLQHVFAIFRVDFWYFANLHYFLSRTGGHGVPQHRGWSRFQSIILIQILPDHAMMDFSQLRQIMIDYCVSYITATRLQLPETIAASTWIWWSYPRRLKVTGLKHWLMTCYDLFGPTCLLVSCAGFFYSLYICLILTNSRLTEVIATGSLLSIILPSFCHWIENLESTQWYWKIMKHILFVLV